MVQDVGEQLGVAVVRRVISACCQDDGISEPTAKQRFDRVLQVIAENGGLFISRVELMLELRLQPGGLWHTALTGGGKNV
ncbi:hypothetical protein HYQ44_007066 [Verticillium longisporum]|nr:hypothetical protein HYQ44_007066 [Verticillium longisporum]